MPVSYVDADDFDALVPSEVRIELYRDESDTDDTASLTRFARAAELASAVALSSARQAGYDPASATTDDMIRATALSLLVNMAYGRKAREVPPSLQNVLGPLPEAVRSGELPLVDEAISSLVEAVGGTKFTPTSESIAVGGTTKTIRREPVMRNIHNLL